MELEAARGQWGRGCGGGGTSAGQDQPRQHLPRRRGQAAAGRSAGTGHSGSSFGGLRGAGHAAWSAGEEPGSRPGPPPPTPIGTPPPGTSPRASLPVSPQAAALLSASVGKHWDSPMVPRERPRDVTAGGQAPHLHRTKAGAPQVRAASGSRPNREHMTRGRGEGSPRLRDAQRGPRPARPRGRFA